MLMRAFFNLIGLSFSLTPALVYWLAGWLSQRDATSISIGTIVAFSTLGLGDIVSHPEWRILAAMAAVNGFLSFGLLTALLVEALRQVRMAQLEMREKD